MKPMTSIRLLVPCLAAALLSVGLAGCGERPPLQVPVTALEGPYRLDTGDQLRIVVFEQPSLTNLYEIDQSGQIAFPLIGDVPARGGTAEELASRIEAKLGTAYLRDPDVTVEVATYRPFFVLGEVGNPGQYVYVPKMTAETAIAAAGGFTDRANERIVRVSRIVNGKLVEERIPVTMQIRAGDTIYVSERLF
jgi:polysaccharide export outer membrane protein